MSHVFRNVVFESCGLSVHFWIVLTCLILMIGVVLLISIRESGEKIRKEKLAFCLKNKIFAQSSFFYFI
jgi:hypothetical protein